ncbi:type II toxin-antitoxin system HipA family toxin [Marinobacterium stanieri]|uniref:Serine/threonine-protein kinase HipA n=1 Tax=Marinobacterium stanieri TaxID=49186 RepID=A0A1N6XK93_9GAMM|nr:HipA domain-containing protein [Marinobacterium stanieri]SIR02723.1 serine/threonine-protein kinase HipA [Marinobacterium stanieri]
MSKTLLIIVMNLSIEIFDGGQWTQAASLLIEDPKKGRLSPARLDYNQSYAVDWMFNDDAHACSLNLPVELFLSHESNHWFGFLDDITPSGASRRYWIEHLGIGNLSVGEQDSILLEKGTIAPVGNLRIRESIPRKPEGLLKQRFSIEDVIDRHIDFLEYAQEMGAVSGGATGAAGEAPKLLIRCTDQNEIWIDTWQDDSDNLDQHYLVKFPRGKGTERDADILRAEFHFYHELTALGVDTIDITNMKLLEGERHPSLWLPRFDVRYDGGTVEHFGLESIYSILDKAPGSHLNHFNVLRDMCAKLNKQHRVAELKEQFDQQLFVTQWLERDLLNLIFANSDNHGRNTAIIKKPEGLWLAPVFDFAPMKADPEDVLRTMKWGIPYEQSGQIDWAGITQELADLADPEFMRHALQALAAKLVGLKGRLIDRGVSESLLSIPALGMGTIEKRLQAWGLL